MKRTLLAAVLGGFMALFAGVFTAEAAPVSAVQVGKTAQPGEALVQKAGWRHRRHYRHHHHHYRRHHGHHHHYYRPRYVYRHHHWRHHHHHYGRHSHRHHRRHYH